MSKWRHSLVVLAGCLIALTTANFNVTIINKTPLDLQVYSVDPETHKTHDTLCKLSVSADSQCSVTQDFIVVHETGLQRGDPFDLWCHAHVLCAVGS